MHVISAFIPILSKKNLLNTIKNVQYLYKFNVGYMYFRVSGRKFHRMLFPVYQVNFFLNFEHYIIPVNFRQQSLECVRCFVTCLKGRLSGPRCVSLQENEVKMRAEQESEKKEKRESLRGQLKQNHTQISKS